MIRTVCTHIDGALDEVAHAARKAAWIGTQGPGSARRQAKRQANEVLARAGVSRYRVLYLADGVERKGPWFANRDRAHQARAILATKYGAAIVYVD